MGRPAFYYVRFRYGLIRITWTENPGCIRELGLMRMTWTKSPYYRAEVSDSLTSLHAKSGRKVTLLTG